MFDGSAVFHARLFFRPWRSVGRGMRLSPSVWWRSLCRTVSRRSGATRGLPLSCARLGVTLHGSGQKQKCDLCAVGNNGGGGSRGRERGRERGRCTLAFVCLRRWIVHRALLERWGIVVTGDGGGGVGGGGDGGGGGGGVF